MTVDLIGEDVTPQVRRAYWLNIFAWTVALVAGMGWRAGFYPRETLAWPGVPLFVLVFLSVGHLAWIVWRDDRV